MRDRVYQNIYSGSFLVALGTMIQVPLDSKQEHFIYMSEKTLPEPMTKHQRSKFFSIKTFIKCSCYCYFHEFRNVERKGQDCDWNNIDKQPLAIAHSLKNLSFNSSFLLFQETMA